MATHSEFAARIRTQLQARYGGVEITVDERAFSTHITGAGIDSQLSLSPLYRACEKDPEAAARLIATWISSIESELTPHSDRPYAPSRLLWCVRSQDYLEEHSGHELLVKRELGDDLVAFVAESLPGSIMRGIPRVEIEAAGDDWREVMIAADIGTDARFSALVQRLEGSSRIPADGWKLSTDSLFAGSAFLCSAALQRLVATSGGAILLGNPDRALSMAIAVNALGAPDFSETMLDLFRQAMNPSSKAVFWSDGIHLLALPMRERGVGFEEWITEPISRLEKLGDATSPSGVPGHSSRAAR
jgi:hypothetical protein